MQETLSACTYPQGARATGERETLSNGAVVSIWRTDRDEYMHVEQPNGGTSWFRLAPARVEVPA